MITTKFVKVTLYTFLIFFNCSRIAFYHIQYSNLKKNHINAVLQNTFPMVCCVLCMIPTKLYKEELIKLKPSSQNSNVVVLYNICQIMFCSTWLLHTCNRHRNFCQWIKTVFFKEKSNFIQSFENRIFIRSYYSTGTFKWWAELQW